MKKRVEKRLPLARYDSPRSRAWLQTLVLIAIVSISFGFLWRAYLLWFGLEAPNAATGHVAPMVDHGLEVYLRADEMLPWQVLLFGGLSLLCISMSLAIAMTRRTEWSGLGPRIKIAYLTAFALALFPAILAVATGGRIPFGMSSL